MKQVDLILIYFEVFYILSWIWTNHICIFFLYFQLIISFQISIRKNCNLIVYFTVFLEKLDCPYLFSDSPVFLKLYLKKKAQFSHIKTFLHLIHLFHSNVFLITATSILLFLKVDCFAFQIFQ